MEEPRFPPTQGILLRQCPSTSPSRLHHAAASLPLPLPTGLHCLQQRGAVALPGTHRLPDLCLKERKEAFTVPSLQQILLFFPLQ